MCLYQNLGPLRVLSFRSRPLTLMGNALLTDANRSISEKLIHTQGVDLRKYWMVQSMQSVVSKLIVKMEISEPSCFVVV